MTILTNLFCPNLSIVRFNTLSLNVEIFVILLLSFLESK